MSRKHQIFSPGLHRVAASFAVVVILTGCATGPNFKQPDVEATAGYTSTPLADHTVAADIAGGGVQKFTKGGDIPALWWQLFKSEPLNKLIDEALAHNPDLKAAKANLTQAEQLAYAGNAAFLPSVDGSLGASRQKTSNAASGGAGGSIFNLFSASLGLTYSPDLFGATRRETEALAAQVDYQKYRLRAAYLTLTANVVNTAVEEASLDAQVTATQAIIKAEEKQLQVLEKQWQLGGASQADVLAQQTQVAQTLATMPALEKALAQTRDRLAILAGRFPSQGAGPVVTLASLNLPDTLPVSLPSELVRQRPDIGAAEALAHAASAQVGVATANMLPHITLSASLGTEANKADNLFSPGSGVWNLVGGLTQPIFEAGKLRHQRKASVAAFDAAMAQYRSTVLSAFGDVADTLHALDADAKSLKAQLAAANAAQASLAISQVQYKDGAISYPDLLNAQKTYQQTRISLVQARAARYTDTAALFVALGGGWWQHDAPQAANTKE